MTMNRRTVLKAIAAGTATMSAPAILRAQSTPVRIGMSGWTGFAPLSLAADAGIFSQKGVNVEIVFIAQKDRLAALASGSLDAVATTVDAQILWATSVPLTQILLLDKSRGGDGIAARSGINSFADLAGKTIACDAVGTAPFFMLAAMLKRNGMSVGDVKLAALSPKDAATAFVAGQFDAAVTYEPYLSTIRNEPNAGKILATTTDYPVIIDTLAFPSDQIDARADQIGAVVEGFFAALDRVAEDPASSFEIMGKRVKQTAEQFKGSAQFIDWQDRKENAAFFKGEIEDFMKMAVEIQLENGVIRSAPALSSLYDARFVKE